MRIRVRNLALIALAAVVASCSEHSPAGPSPFTPNFDLASGGAVRISEFHYDNAGTDAGEFVEISGPAGTSVAGWSIVLYNGSATSLRVYDTDLLSGTIPTTCDPRGVVVQTYPANGIQNGNPDAIALVDDAAQVIQFISYGGSFTALDGPAAGLTSVDIGVNETSTTPVGFSLQVNGSGVWAPPAANTLGVCNDDSGPPPPAVDSIAISPTTATIVVGGTQAFTASAFDAAGQPIPSATFSWASDAPAIATVSSSGLATGVAPGDANITATSGSASASAALHVDAATPPGFPETRLAEIHYDNFGVDVGEAIEVEGPAGTSLAGWSIVLYNGNGGVVYNTAPLTGIIADQCSGRGTVSVSYPQDGIQNGSPDGIALVDNSNTVVEFLSYEGTFTATAGPAAGMLSVDIGAAQSSSPIGQTLQRDASNAWALAASTLGACNSGGGGPPPPAFTFSFSGRLASDPALPVGFQDQLFVTVRDAGGTVVTTPIVWSSDTPALASIDQNGVMTALAVGTAVFRATTSDNAATGTYSLPTIVAVPGNTAQYAGNAEFGEPADGDASNDFIVHRDQYTASFNQQLGTPNWVSYNLEASHFGPEDRCDCFTFDPALPPTFTSYTTADYTGAGAFHGYGIDRGHMARSFDRTTGSLDNATTYYFTNIIPQAADLNQGPWAIMENDLGDLARFQDREVYIVTGPAGSKGTIKNLGLINIPSAVWKVALILPRNQGLADVHSAQDVQIIAVIAPNDPGVRNVDWHSYETTVDAVEALSGYDLFALLPDQIEIAVESNTQAPVAVADGPYTSFEGSAVSLSAGGSSDPDGDALTFAWDFGDTGAGSGATVSHTWAQNGVYTVTLTATDIHGLTSVYTTTATISNVAPVIAPFSGATLIRGETWAVDGSFTDPGADLWTATVDYGDGSGQASLALAGQQFSLTHRYTTAGTFNVGVRVLDDVTMAQQSATVTVLTPAQGVQAAIEIVRQMENDGVINRGLEISLIVKLELARRLFQTNKQKLGVVALDVVLLELNALVRARRLTDAQALPLRTMVRRVIQSVQTVV